MRQNVQGVGIQTASVKCSLSLGMHRYDALPYFWFQRLQRCPHALGRGQSTNVILHIAGLLMLQLGTGNITDRTYLSAHHGSSSKDQAILRFCAKSATFWGPHRTISLGTWEVLTMVQKTFKRNIHQSDTKCKRSSPNFWCHKSHPNHCWQNKKVHSNP